MSKLTPDSNKDSASRSSESVSKGISSDIEILFERPTGWQPPYEILRHGIAESILDGETALFDVLPGVGKTRSISKVSDVVPISLFTNLRKNYGQFEDFGDEDGVNVERLPVANDLCPLFRDDGPSYQRDTGANEAREAYSDGWPASLIHREIDTPCDRGNNTCPYRERVAEIDSGGLAALVGHYKQAYNPTYIEERVVVIDEDCFDDFIEEIKNPVEKAEEYIATLDDFPFNGVPYRPTDTELKEAIEILENEGLEPADHRDTVGAFHAKAPLVAYALLTADRMENDWFVADLPADRTATFYQRPGKGPLHLLDPPDFSGAEAIIALDATPCIADWTRLLGDGLKHYRLFDDDQRNQYLREQGYEFVQLNNRIWPVSDGGVSVPKCEAYLREVSREHGQRPDLITSKKIIEGGKNWKDEYIEGLEDRDLDHLWRDHLHYGNLRGRGDLEESELLVVLGSPGRSDLNIQYHATFHGECAEPATDDEGDRLTGYDLDYQSEVANEYLDSVRRGGVFQAAMRAGRTEDAEAAVYIATGLVPHWLETKKAGYPLPNGSFDACPRSNLRSPGEREVIEAVRGETGISTSEIVDKVSIGQEMVKKHRKTLQDRGLIEKEGERRWAKYSDNGLETLNIAGDVDLSLSGNMPIKNSIRAKYPIESLAYPVIPHRPPPADPTLRYPDWMRDVQQRLEARSLDEQLAQRWRDQS